MNFEADIRDHILRVLPYDESDHNTMTELYCMDVTTLLTYYLNRLNRLIEPRPRKVHQSKELLSNPLSKSFSILLTDITLQRHFSTSTKFAHVESRFCGGKQRGKAAYCTSTNPCARRACSRSVAVGIIQKIENGTDITCHLSKSILSGYTSVSAKVSKSVFVG
jgi:hypothetical protein